MTSVGDGHAAAHRAHPDPGARGLRTGERLRRCRRFRLSWSHRRRCNGDASDVFTAFVAVTENRYDVLLVSPVTTQLSSGAVAVQVKPPGEGHCGEVIALWLSLGADHETVALSEPDSGRSSGRSVLLPLPHR